MMLAWAMFMCSTASSKNANVDVERVSVNTLTDIVVGTTDGSTNKWLGIPYAEAPVGDLRWELPRPRAARPSSEALDASSFGPACYQDQVQKLGEWNHTVEVNVLM